MNTRRSRFILLALSAASCCSIGAFAADNPGKPGEGPAQGWNKRSPEEMRQHMAKRQARLHDQLQLKPNQEAAWKTWVAAVAPPGMGKHWDRSDRAGSENLPAPVRLERRLQSDREHEARMAARLAATKTFYATLSPQQRQIFDTETAHRRHRMQPDRQVQPGQEMPGQPMPGQQMPGQRRANG